ncbi:oxidative stress survival, Svf1-like protein [Catenaria anguillulae PL171]|uniref:Oxidative stress survival, Svf1-like protein n=1 Tax=Catenaria anguillulae PL171 TaxID=765915 RepID=A0A1Y2HQ51_9FUNG|nr:oxidative stress survival, Svf1-like protein [Catenaria anguillulae PL171]
MLTLSCPTLAGTAVALPQTIPTPAAVAWLKEGSGYSETQTFYLFPATGGLCFVQLAYSEVSLSPLAQVTVYISTPSCSYFKSFNNSGSALKVAAGDRAGSTCNDYSVTSAGDGKFVIALKNKEVVANLTVDLSAESTLKVGDAKVHFTPKGGAKPDGYLATTYGTRGTASGVIMANGAAVDVSGRATLVHQYQGISPHKIATQWNFFTFATPSISLTTVSGTTPATYNSETFATLAADVTGLGSLVATEQSLEFPTTAVDATTGYAVPKTFKMHSVLNNGYTLEASGNLDFGKVNRIDVLGELPWLVRKAVQYFVSKPFVYQYVDGSAKVVVKDAEGKVVAEEQGVGMFEVSFTNPPN